MSTPTPQTLAVHLSTAQRGLCRSCGAAITWYRLTSEKLHPFDADPPVEVQDSLLGEPASTGYVPASASHFVTCPDASTWRKARLQSTGSQQGGGFA